MSTSFPITDGLAVMAAESEHPEPDGYWSRCGKMLATELSLVNLRRLTPTLLSLSEIICDRIVNNILYIRVLSSVASQMMADGNVVVTRLFASFLVCSYAVLPAPVKLC